MKYDSKQSAKPTDENSVTSSRNCIVEVSGVTVTQTDVDTYQLSFTAPVQPIETAKLIEELFPHTFPQVERLLTIEAFMPHIRQ